jgi:hypothetical protein
MVINVIDRIGRKSLRVAALFTVLVITSCGIFSPRDSTSPGDTVTNDPLSFSSIMSGTRKSFAKLQYEDLFTSDLYYVDNNSQIYTKQDLIPKLNQIPQSHESIKVVWKPGDQPRELGTGDTIVLSGLTYFVYLTGNMTSVPDDSGNSDFVVTEDNQSIWHISSWRDIPLRSGRSFFVQ